MTEARWARPRRSRIWIGLVAALVVQGLGVGLLWLDHGAWRLGGRGDEVRLTEVRLIAPTRPPRSQDEERDRPRPTRPMSAIPGRLPAPIMIAAPEVVVTSTPDAPPAVSTGSAPTPGSGRTTLNLALPRQRAASDPVLRMADEVRSDPRSHSERRSVEWAIADAAGSLPIETAVSTSGSGSKLVRQGSKCVRVYENRVAAMNPTDERLKGAPALAGNCFSK